MIILLLKKLKIKIGNILLNEFQKFVNQKKLVAQSKDLKTLLNTVENVTIAKKSYETFCNTIERNFYLTMLKLFIDERDKIKEDFLR